MTKSVNTGDLNITELTHVVNKLRDLEGVKALKKVQSKADGIAEVERRLKAQNRSLSLKRGEDNFLEFQIIDNPPKKTRARFRDDDVIKVLRDEKPKKATGRNPYAVYQTGMTVREALDAGVKRRDINYDANPDRKAGAVIAIVPSDSHDATKLREAFEAAQAA